MKARLLAWVALGTLLAVPAISSAQQPGEIFGKVTDSSGAIMPGVTVTLSSPMLLRPLVATTTDSGSYRFPQLAVGLYTVRFELPGFATVVREGIRIEIGFNAQINVTMTVSSVEETVTVTGESPIVDTRDISRGSRFNQEALQAIPSARDPWVIIEQAAGVMMDRSNVGGSQSGQQSNFVARGAAFTEQKWNLDGVDITDMAATGGSPIYFDFDAFEEMQISTGGADVSMQSPGVSVNIVTKSGTDQLKGSTRYYITDEKLQSVNITDELRRQGASTGNPIQNIKDYGVEAGGPLLRGRAWLWGSYGKQNISVGVNNFYKASTECQAMKANPLAYSVDEIRTCLSSDTTLLNNYNLKFSANTFRNNQASMFFNGAEKVRNARDASDLRPLETTWRQTGVTREDLGSKWWRTGMPKSYKWSDRHIFTDRFLMEASYAHVGNNFTLTFHEEDLRTIQPSYDILTGLWGRSYYEDVYVRPTDSLDVMANYFLPGLLGGDHSLKMGFKWRNDTHVRETMYGGDAYARFRSGVPVEAQLYRRQQTESLLMNRNAYVQDSFERGRMTIIAGLRFDYQTDEVSATGVSASPFYGQATFAGVYNGVTYTGKVFDQLPAASFGGAKALGDKSHAFINWSPRAGLSYDLTGDGQNVAKVNYARYVGQLGGNSGFMAVRYNPMVLTFVRYPWVDLDGDKVIQANEIVYTAAPLSWTTGYNHLNPTQMTTTGTVDPDISNETTDEVIASFDRQIGRDFAVGASYIWRKYSNFRGVDIQNFDETNWAPVSWTPPGCPAGASCPAVTYYQPTRLIPTNYLYTNINDFWREYNGFELTARKRYADNWQLNGNFSYNNAPIHFDSPDGYLWWVNNSDPTNIENTLNGSQYAPQSTTSGIDNVYVNARWATRLSGSYTLPWWQVGIAAVYQARDGYPFIRSVLSPARPFGAGTVNVFLDKRGDERLPTFQAMDLRFDKPITIMQRLKVVASVDIFNLMNANTTLSMRGTQNASNANTISALLSPRVVRFGFRATW